MTAAEGREGERGVRIRELTQSPTLRGPSTPPSDAPHVRALNLLLGQHLVPRHSRERTPNRDDSVCGRTGGGDGDGGLFFRVFSCARAHEDFYAPSLTDARHSPLGEKRTAFTVFVCACSVHKKSTRVSAAPSTKRHILISLSAPAVAKIENVGWTSVDRLSGDGGSWGQGSRGEAQSGARVTPKRTWGRSSDPASRAKGAERSSRGPSSTRKREPRVQSTGPNRD